jgi:hypothetical protein
MSEPTHDQLNPNSTDTLTPAEQQVKLAAFKELARWMLNLAPEMAQVSDAQVQVDDVA